jgi:hypothetical protein
MAIEWEQQSPGWLGHGAEHDYLVHRQDPAEGGRVVLARWVRPEPGSEGTLAGIVREALAHAIFAHDASAARLTAEDFERGTLATTPPGWVRRPQVSNPDASVSRSGPLS